MYLLNQWARSVSFSVWTAHALKVACIFLLSIQIVKQVESISIRVQKELVLLHKEGVAHPKGTVKWLNALGWLSSYFHVSLIQ